MARFDMNHRTNVTADSAVNYKNTTMSSPYNLFMVVNNGVIDNSYNMLLSNRYNGASANIGH